MQRNDFEATLAVYEAGFNSIEAIIGDDSLSARDKVDAIASVIYGDDEDSDEESEGDD